VDHSILDSNLLLLLLELKLSLLREMQDLLLSGVHKGEFFLLCFLNDIQLILKLLRVVLKCEHLQYLICQLLKELRHLICGLQVEWLKVNGLEDGIVFSLKHLFLGRQRPLQDLRP
jgi:hypothetical protein